MNGGVEVASTNFCDAGSSTTGCVVVVAMVQLLRRRRGSGGTLLSGAEAARRSAGDGLAEPVLEAGRGDACAAARGEGVVVELRAEVEGVDVGRHEARVVPGAKEAPGELVEPELLRASQLDDPV